VANDVEHPLKAPIVPGLARELVALVDRSDEIIFDAALSPFYRNYYSPELMLPGLEYAEGKIHEMIEKLRARAREEGNEHGHGC
jgi:hypothetical protein